VYWESDQPIVAMKPRNGGGAKGVTRKLLRDRTLIVFLKSRMRETRTSGSVRQDL